MRKEAAILAGVSPSYVTKILNVNDKRSNPKVIQICEKLVEAKESAFAKVLEEVIND